MAFSVKEEEGELSGNSKEGSLGRSASDWSLLAHLLSFQRVSGFPSISNCRQLWFFALRLALLKAICLYLKSAQFSSDLNLR